MMALQNPTANQNVYNIRSDFCFVCVEGETHKDSSDFDDSWTELILMALCVVWDRPTVRKMPKNPDSNNFPTQKIVCPTGRKNFVRPSKIFPSVRRPSDRPTSVGQIPGANILGSHHLGQRSTSTSTLSTSMSLSTSPSPT